MSNATPKQIVFALANGRCLEATCQQTVPWWSFSKVPIAMAALSLVSNGKLDLDSPIDGRRFTLRHLLQHQSGLPDYGGLVEYHRAVQCGEEVWADAELLERTGASSLLFAPGSAWRYSNIGYMLVRQKIENTTGLPLGEALQELVFGPLAIKDVEVASTPSQLDSTAWGNAVGYDPRWVFHGLLVGPAVAAASLLHRLLSGDFLPYDLLCAMRSAYELGGPLPDRPWKNAGYGLGLMIGQGDPPGLYLGHTGEGPGSVSAVYAKVVEGDRFGILRTVAAFSADNTAGNVERFAMERASET